MHRAVVAFLLAPGLLASCSGNGYQAALDRWHRTEPRAYSFTLVGGAMSGSTKLATTVRDGRVTAVRDERPGIPEPLTVDEVFAQLLRDQRVAAKVMVTYDPRWGFPASVQVDHDERAIDDEYSYGVTDFRPLTD